MKFGSRPTAPADDEVVASFNVYFSPSLTHQAHIFQYPLRRKQRPYEATEVRLFSTNVSAHDGGEASPASSKDHSVFSAGSRLTMKCSLDTFGSPSFKPSQEASSDFMSQMDVQRLNTYSYTLHSQPFQTQSNYMLGYITAEGIHLTPVSTIQHFTPALDIPSASTGAVRVAESFCSQPNSSATPGFAAAERIQRELQRQRSYVLNKEADSEREVQVFRANSVESSAMRSRLRSPTLESVIGGVKGTAEQGRVENSLFPPEILQSGGISGGDESNPSMVIQRFAHRTSVVEQTMQLLQRCHIITLPLLQTVIVPHTSNDVVKAMATVPDTQLVEALKTCAVWMHGVWVSRFCDQFRGSVAALREVVLTRFYQSPDGSVTRAELNALVSSSTSRRSIKDILRTVAVLNAEESDPTKRRWRLKYVSANPVTRDAAIRAFKSVFAAEEASQHEAWKRRCAQVATHLPYINANRPPLQLFLLARGSAPPTGSLASTAASLYVGGGGLSSASSPVSSGMGGLPGTSACAAPFSSPNASGASMTFKDADIAPIRNYIRELFAEYGVINKQRVKDLVMRAQESRYPHASKAMLSMALQQSLDKFTDATWVLKSVGEPLADYYRPTILAIVLELRQFELSVLMRRLEDAIRERGLTSPPETAATARANKGGASGSSAPEAVVQRVVAEVAEFKAGGRLWHIKGGNLMND
ncbi:hypothetical protein ABB37_07726 [Leptomonas pyrrhocoris]|uniref:Uncharacterized protein n=1 Tax=Leptomonas pyrrhocoris TaxID=157538 RepID=A0A0M9FUX6_LEPPY|nr:hypothetical protein ABB37_07726 [Leptomonas pyrrhocoris]KPA76386.1 hypothetical protein ABB37_07726 [Leptomonas pyrrhocoris]|eukprot:XP_015654825.1 hypothetical protein ABB37_07726 [Leptomonas pyrrhocoris]